MMRASKVEVQVVDEKLLIEGIVYGKNASKLISDAEIIRGTADINLVDMAPRVQVLTLSFKKIGKIENLVGFESLAKLCLDNNFIEEIANLGHLKNLRWLDLSFNKIKIIKGLDNLVHLEDLSLYSNKISSVEGLDNCKSLQCLSLGNNYIESLDQIIKLRQIRSLRMLTLADNPVCSESEYKNTVFAYIDNIKYLDYALVDQEERDAAREQYQEDLIDVQDKEAVIEEKESRERDLKILLAKLDEAGILFAHTIFDDMFGDDPDIEKLKHLPGVKELVDQSFRVPFKLMSDDFIRASLERFSEKKKDVAEFDKSVVGVRAKDEAESTQLINGFNKSKKGVVVQLTNGNTNIPHSERVRMVKKLQDELDKVCDELLSIEMRLVDKFDALVDQFDDRMGELKNIAIEQQQLFFHSVEELEDKFVGALRGLSNDLIERLAREELAEDYLDDEGMSLVSDKDVCMAVITVSHDMHVGRILKREDEARGMETKRYQELVASYTAAERTRNRNRILEIHQFSRESHDSLMSLLAMDDDDAYEEDEQPAALLSRK